MLVMMYGLGTTGEIPIPELIYISILTLIWIIGNLGTYNEMFIAYEIHVIKVNKKQMKK